MKVRSVFMCIMMMCLTFCMFSNYDHAFGTTESTTEGFVVKVVGDIIFLDGPDQPAYHVTETTLKEGVSALQELVGETVSIKFQAVGNINVISVLKVIETPAK